MYGLYNKCGCAYPIQPPICDHLRVFFGRKGEELPRPSIFSTTIDVFRGGSKMKRRQMAAHLVNNV